MNKNRGETTTEDLSDRDAFKDSRGFFCFLEAVDTKSLKNVMEVFTLKFHQHTL